MALVAVYILFNIIVARFLEKRKLRVAIIAHAVMFALLLIDIILIIITGVIAAAIVAKKVIDVVTKRGKRVYVRADKDENVYFRNPTKERERRYKIYLKNCVILC